jgi:hypothetical protein
MRRGRVEYDTIAVSEARGHLAFTEGTIKFGASRADGDHLLVWRVGTGDKKVDVHFSAIRFNGVIAFELSENYRPLPHFVILRIVFPFRRLGGVEIVLRYSMTSDKRETEKRSQGIG